MQLPAFVSGASEAEDFLVLRPGADDPPQCFALKAMRLAAAHPLPCRQRRDRKVWWPLMVDGQIEAFRQMQFSLR